MFIVLSEDLITGNAEFDRHHQHLLDTANAIAITQSPDARAKVTAGLRLITGQAEQHFGAEEQVMEMLGCPWAAHHIRAHQQLLEWLEQLMRSLDQGKDPAAIQLRLHHGIQRRYLTHIRQADGRLARWLHKRVVRLGTAVDEQMIWAQTTRIEGGLSRPRLGERHAAK